MVDGGANLWYDNLYFLMICADLDTGILPC